MKSINEIALEVAVKQNRWAQEHYQWLLEFANKFNEAWLAQQEPVAEVIQANSQGG